MAQDAQNCPIQAIMHSSAVTKGVHDATGIGRTQRAPEVARSILAQQPDQQHVDRQGGMSTASLASEYCITTRHRRNKGAHRWCID